MTIISSKKLRVKTWLLILSLHRHRSLCLLPILRDHGIMMVMGPCGMQWCKFPPHISLLIQGMCVLFGLFSIFSIFYQLYLHNKTCNALVKVQWSNSKKNWIMNGNWKCMFIVLIKYICPLICNQFTKCLHHGAPSTLSIPIHVHNKLHFSLQKRCTHKSWHIQLDILYVPRIKLILKPIKSKASCGLVIA